MAPDLSRLPACPRGRTFPGDGPERRAGPGGQLPSTGGGRSPRDENLPAADAKSLRIEFLRVSVSIQPLADFWGKRADRREREVHAVVNRV